MAPKISIIIPVYNVESYLHYCIHSIFIPTYKNFEVLLINDGSTDHSGDICNELALDDSRIRVFHKENGGVSSARNLGLINAKGEWICFVDSDDWIESDTLEKIIQQETANVDFIQFGFQMKKTSGEIILKSHIPDRILIYDYKSYFSTDLFHSAICGYLIKKDTIEANMISFPENIKYGEDQIFILEALMCSQKILFLNQYLYNYRYREGSAMHSSNTLSRAEDHLKVISNLSIFMSAQNIGLMSLHISFIKSFILSFIIIGLDSTCNLYKIKNIFHSFCNNIKNYEIFKLCKRYDSYIMILLYYLYLKSIIYLKQIKRTK